MVREPMSLSKVPDLEAMLGGSEESIVLRQTVAVVLPYVSVPAQRIEGIEGRRQS
jgi:hypothetical protein